MLTSFVDDILLTETSIKLLHDVRGALKTEVSFSELGPGSLILGMEVVYEIQNEEP